MFQMFSDEELERCTEAYVKWVSPAHSVRTPTEEDRQRAKAVLSEFVRQRADDVKPCDKKEHDFDQHIHINGRVVGTCSWHPGEYHGICGEACN